MALAVGLFAVAYPITRYAAEAKPYGCDSCWPWPVWPWQSSGCDGRTRTGLLAAVLAPLVGPAVGYSFRPEGQPWGTFTIAATMPIAVFMGLYLRYWRPGKVLECSAVGFVLVLAAIVGGQWVAESPALAPLFTLGAMALAIAIIVYGFLASALPVWLLLAPRDYLSTFVKLGVVVMLAVGHSVRPAGTAVARTHALRGWHRADFRRQNLSVLLHHHRLRRHLRIPLADLFGHHAENDRQGVRTPGRWATAPCCWKVSWPSWP